MIIIDFKLSFGLMKSMKVSFMWISLLFLKWLFYDATHILEVLLAEFVEVIRKEINKQTINNK